MRSLRHDNDHSATSGPSMAPTARVRWAAIGAAIAVSLGAGGISIARATGDSPSSFVPVTPTRILDTRAGVAIGLEGAFTSPTGRSLGVTGTIATASGYAAIVPLGATAIVLNVTAVAPTADGFLSVRPAGTPGPPSTSSLNFRAGDIVPNAVTVALPADGAIEITYDAFGAAGPTTDVLVDVTGYYVKGGSGGTTGPAGPTGPPGPAGPAGVDGAPGAAAPRPSNVVWVAKSGGDHTNVQAAIDASPAGTIIMIAPGTYTGRVTIKSGITLQGAGRELTTLQSTAGAENAPGSAVVRGSGVDGATIRDIAIRNVLPNPSGPSTFAFGVRLEDSNVTVDDVDIAADGAGSTYGLAFEGGEIALSGTDVFASSGSITVGVDNDGGTLRVDGGSIIAQYGAYVVGLQNDQAVAFLDRVEIAGLDTASGTENAIRQFGSQSIVRSSVLRVTNRPGPQAVANEQGSLVQIAHSEVFGPVGGGGAQCAFVSVGFAQLDGVCP